MKSKLLRLKDNAWKTFSKWIRERDGHCVTCGAGAENAGHFWHNMLDFDEININAQCVHCNKWMSGNLAVYAIYLIKKHGLRKFLDLYDRHNLEKGKTHKYDEAYY